MKAEEQVDAVPFPLVTRDGETGPQPEAIMRRHRKLLVLLVVILCCLAQRVVGQDIGWKIVTDVAAKAEREGRFADAEEGYQRALDLVKKSAGPASPDVAIALSNLAMFY